jgi:hypothetical protein
VLGQDVMQAEVLKVGRAINAAHRCVIRKVHAGL